MNHSTPTTPGKEPRYMQAAGKLPHPLTNDYMFKALLQENENVLRELVCSLLHLQPEEVQSLEITNPIILGKALTEDFDSKTFVLDINVLLNSRMLINLELQVADFHNWPERTMAYLCRNFDQLQKGEDYIRVKPTVHIGFLDFTPFPEHPEFYATYKMMNVKNHHIYTDKFVLSVVDLKHIELATQEDKKWKLDYWASLFKSTTWEELKMLAQQSQVLKEAVETIYDLTADEAIREQCKAREKYIKEMNTVLRERDIERQEKEQERREKEAAQRETEQERREKEAAQRETEQERREKEAAQRETEQERREKEAAQRETEQERREKEQALEKVAEQDQQLEQQGQRLEQKDQQLEQKDQQIAQLLQELERLKAQHDAN